MAAICQDGLLLNAETPIVVRSTRTCGDTRCGSPKGVSRARRTPSARGHIFHLFGIGPPSTSLIETTYGDHARRISRTASSLVKNSLWVPNRTSLGPTTRQCSLFTAQTAQARQGSMEDPDHATADARFLRAEPGGAGQRCGSDFNKLTHKARRYRHPRSQSARWATCMKRTWSYR